MTTRTPRKTRRQLQIMCMKMMLTCKRIEHKYFPDYFELSPELKRDSIHLLFSDYYFAQSIS